jgi:NhaA family Na+:H+ antiporter
MRDDSARRSGGKRGGVAGAEPTGHGAVGSTAERRRRRHHRVWATSIPHLSQFVIEHLLLLPLGALIALVWVNTVPEGYYRFTYAISFAVNDVGMALFFALMTKEVVEAMVPDGVLHPWRRATLPVIASIGAAAVPALIHVRIVNALDEPMLAAGWPVSLATDLAMSYFAARIIFGQHPVIPFVILVGIGSDAMGFLALALFDPATDLRLGTGVLLLMMAMAIAGGLRRARVTSFWPYLIAAGGASWYAFFWSGLHPALALVPIMPFFPHGARDPGFFEDALPDARDTLSQFEIWWRYPAQAALFLFGLVNAGVPIGALEQGTWGLLIAVLAGKPLGVLLGAGLAIVGGLHLPHGVGWREMTVGGLTTAMGFSVGLFFCAALLPPGQLRSELSMGVLLSFAGAPLALLSARLLHVGRFSDD